MIVVQYSVADCCYPYDETRSGDGDDTTRQVAPYIRDIAHMLGLSDALRVLRRTPYACYDDMPQLLGPGSCRLD